MNNSRYLRQNMKIEIRSHVKRTKKQGNLLKHSDSGYLRSPCCYTGPHPADDLSCPLRPRPYKGKLIQPSDKEVVELRSTSRNLLRKTSRAEAAAAAATGATTITAPVSAQSPSRATGASTSASQDIPPASLNRFSALENASSQYMEIDSDVQAPNNTLSLALHE